jgi:hypothetical protein
MCLTYKATSLSSTQPGTYLCQSLHSEAPSLLGHASHHQQTNLSLKQQQQQQQQQ